MLYWEELLHLYIKKDTSPLCILTNSLKYYPMDFARNVAFYFFGWVSIKGYLIKNNSAVFLISEYY